MRDRQPIVITARLAAIRRFQTEHEDNQQLMDGLDSIASVHHDKAVHEMWEFIQNNKQE